MTRDVFHHTAYEVHADLVDGLRALVPLVIAGDARLAPRFIELDREAHARSSRPLHVGRDEAERTRARLSAFGLDDVALPELVADGTWRHLQRSIARLERVRELGGPVELLRDDFLRAAHDLAPHPYVAPREVSWPHAADFVSHAVALAATTLDDVGIGGAINETPEAIAFFERHPHAYTFWDIHRALEPGEDPDLPDPLRYPAAIWTAAAITLAEPFADLPCGSDGPATIQPAGVAPGAHLHPALARSCEIAARAGHALVGFVEVHA